MNSTHLYRPTLRPASYGGMPQGVCWAYVEAPAMHGLANRPDLPTSRHLYGVISTDRALTAAECKQFDMAKEEAPPGGVPFLSPDRVERRLSFQFKVNGTQQCGVIYVTLSFTDATKAVAKATKIAAKRSGDPKPEFLRNAHPMR